MKGIKRWRSNSGRTHNVMTPLNWMCVVSETILLPTGALNHDNWFGIGCFILASLIVVFYASMYLFFSIKSPSSLQTEDYNLSVEEMKLHINASSSEPIIVRTNIIDPTMSQSITSAQLPKDLPRS